MSLEQSIQNLADAINALAKATQHSGSMTGAAGAITALAAAASAPDDDQPKRGRGRPRKVEPTATSDEFPAEVEAPVAPAPAPVAPASATVDAAMLRPVLIEVVKVHGRDKCGELCRKYGGPNLSALDPKVYPALYAEAKELLAQDAAG